MCNHRNSVERKINGKVLRLDECLAETIVNLNKIGIKTRASCCGHGKYPLTIITVDGIELTSNLNLGKRRNYYEKDRNGFYFIPELVGREILTQSR